MHHNEGLKVAINWQDADSSSAKGFRYSFSNEQESKVMLCGGHVGRAHGKRLEELKGMSSFSQAFIALHKSHFPAVQSVKCCCAGKKHTFVATRNTVPLKSKLPPSHETRLVSLEIRLERNEMSPVSRECTEVPILRIRCIRNLFCLFHVRCQYRIISVSAVDMIFILIRNACVPCVYYKSSSV